MVICKVCNSYFRIPNCAYCSGTGRKRFSGLNCDSCQGTGESNRIYTYCDYCGPLGVDGPLGTTSSHMERNIKVGVIGLTESKGPTELNFSSMTNYATGTILSLG